VSLLVEGKVALVTGGSRGLGRAICKVLAREGADVAFTYHKNETEAAATGRAIEATGRRSLAYRCSVLDRAAIDRTVADVEEKLGRIDILVNNAGVTQVMPFALIEEEDWDLVIDTNVKGTYLVSRSVARGMIRRRYGKIVNISSLAGVTLIKAPVHYATSKAAIHGFTMALSKELARYNIHVNGVAPGLLEEGVGTYLNVEQHADYMKHCSLGRPGTTAEIAELVTFVASDRCSYLSGTTLLADGGL
jgi:NAD(P)-dependent dehydrogenase (short-subunit alcohol dehydrogenase family)